MLDLVAAWKSATTSQKQGLVHGFFLKGLPFSEERKFFEPGNRAKSFATQVVRRSPD